MRQKYDLYVIFGRFRDMVERMFSCKTKSVQFDLGDEYKKLHSRFVQLGIVHR